MTKPEILEEIPVHTVEVKDRIAKIKKRDGELNFRANKAEEYLNLFVKLKASEGKAFVEELEGLSIPRLRIEHICKIIDTMPLNAAELKSILQMYTVTISQDNLKKIVAVVDNYRK